MRTFAFTLAFLVVAVLTAMGQSANVVNSSRSNIKNNFVIAQGPDGKTHCTVADKPCTKDQVTQLNAALPGMKTVKSGPDPRSVKSISLAKDGSLVCETAAGTVPCTAAHITDLKAAATRVNNELENRSAPPVAK
ncbi:MAG: hypothetical protein ABSF62_13795 [Bryobacteraceae bacterium]